MADHLSKTFKHISIVKPVENIFERERDATQCHCRLSRHRTRTMSGLNTFDLQIPSQN